MSGPDRLNRRDFLSLGSASMLTGLAGVAAAEPPVARAQAQPPEARTASRKRPNIILFMPDELRADALACYGNPVTKTPNMDRLAASGTRFENCHVQYPVCGASRCSLLTGWPTSVRGHRSLFYFLRPEEPNMFRTLKHAGYDVFWFGKNDALATECFYDSVTRWNDGKARGGVLMRQATPGTSKAAAEAAPTTFLRGAEGDPENTHDFSLVKQAIEILESKDRERPFCIFLPMSTPHPPYGAPVGFHDMYHPSQITNLRPIGLKNRPNYFDGIRRAYNLESLPASVFQDVRAKYYGAVSYSDWMLGQLLDAVDGTGHAEDTAIFLLSDHGDYGGDYGLVEKWPSGLEDCLTHVPLIARVPGGTKGHTVANMHELYDVMATCLELAGTKANHTNFARSLLPELHGGAGDPNRAAHAEGGYNIYEPQCFENGDSKGELYYPKTNLQSTQPDTITRCAMVRTRKYKFVSRPQGPNELYIYEDDPQELNNRYGDPAVAAVQAEMEQRLLHWYVNTTGIAPKDKDPRDLPPYYSTIPGPAESAVVTILDEG